MERRIRTQAAAARGASTPPAPAPRTRPSPQRTERGRATLTTEAVDMRTKLPYHSETQEIPLQEATIAPGEVVAEVEVRAGLTRNMGDFNSLRIDCFARIQCPAPRMNEAYDLLSDFVADKVSEEEAKWTGESTR